MLDNIKIHEVPIWIKRIDFDELNSLDKSICQVIKYIDGDSCISRITEICKLGRNYVKYIIYNLYLKNYISFVDMFDMENIYRANKKLKEMFTSKEDITKEFEEFCYANTKGLPFQKNKFKNEVSLDISC